MLYIHLWFYIELHVRPFWPKRLAYYGQNVVKAINITVFVGDGYLSNQSVVKTTMSFIKRDVSSFSQSVLVSTLLSLQSGPGHLPPSSYMHTVHHSFLIRGLVPKVDTEVCGYICYWS